MAYHTGPHRKAPELTRMQGSDENLGKGLYCGFCGQELAIRWACLGLTSLTTFSGFNV